MTVERGPWPGTAETDDAVRLYLGYVFKAIDLLSPGATESLYGVSGPEIEDLLRAGSAPTNEGNV